MWSWSLNPITQAVIFGFGTTLIVLNSFCGLSAQKLLLRCLGTLCSARDQTLIGPCIRQVSAALYFLSGSALAAYLKWYLSAHISHSYPHFTSLLISFPVSHQCFLLLKPPLSFSSIVCFRALVKIRKHLIY